MPLSELRVEGDVSLARHWLDNTAHVADWPDWDFDAEVIRIWVMWDSSGYDYAAVS
ncbi:hypothetical protein [Actinoplanes solisilvae]|uniref:hypothetical protein n=1 Tax=Actinoplanes solisilvae TaxID=2486853 RepID=UPI0013E33A1B|nr:hypothetical protein [Actinoplanes solisilvae]